MTTLSRALLAATLLLVPALVFVPTGSAFTCAVGPNPIPGSPVGGQVGVVYNTARGTAWTGFIIAFGTTCAVVALTIAAANAQCRFWIGMDCISIA